MSAALKQATQVKIQMSVVKGPHAGQTFNLNKTTLTLGRGPENDIILVNDPLVSRNHARIELNQGEFDLINLSQKNGLLVQGEYVDKSRLVNDAVFQIGDSEIQFQFDFGHAVVSVQPSINNPGTKLTIAKPMPVAKNTSAVAKQPQFIANQAPKNPIAKPLQQNSINKPIHNFTQTGYAIPGKAYDSDDEKNKKIRFYAVVAIVILAAVYFLTGNSKSKSSKPKPLLKYEDEITFNLKSKQETDLRKKREEDKKAKDSPQVQRAEENFIKGMRDYQLGNYARAQDFFQVVLNLAPDHALARRHLYLSKVRFDELVQAKLMLGESYYQKHNFDMCQSMYKQVMDMLQGKSSDQKYELAQRMLEKCQLAAEGIR